MPRRGRIGAWSRLSMACAGFGSVPAVVCAGEESERPTGIEDRDAWGARARGESG